MSCCVLGGSETLPIIMVAITAVPTVRHVLPALKHIRDIQLNFTSSLPDNTESGTDGIANINTNSTGGGDGKGDGANINTEVRGVSVDGNVYVGGGGNGVLRGNVGVVDAFGLLLQKDGLHLTTDGQLKLGQEIYKTYIKMINNTVLTSRKEAVKLDAISVDNINGVGNSNSNGVDNSDNASSSNSNSVGNINNNSASESSDDGYTKTGTANTWWGGNEWGWVGPRQKQLTTQLLKPCFDQVLQTPVHSSVCISCTNKLCAS